MATPYLKDPWEARDAYIQIMLQPAAESRDAFLTAHATRDLTHTERVLVWKLLEIERHALLMYTSCGWFFDEISGLEAVQVLRYAGRALDLARETLGEDFDAGFLGRLKRAPSNLPRFENGAEVYRQLVQPAQADAVKIGAHFAIRTLFEPNADTTNLYGFECHVEEIQIARSGAASVLLGKVQLTQELTEEVFPIQFLVLHFGDHHLTVGARVGRMPFNPLVRSVRQAFDGGDLATIVHILEQEFAPTIYPLGQLLADERQNLLEKILSHSLSEAESALSQMYERHAPLAGLLQNAHIPLPKVLSLSIEWVLNRKLEQALRAPEWDHEAITRILAEAQNWSHLLNAQELSYTAATSLVAMGRAMQARLGELDVLENLAAALTLAKTFPFEMDLRTLQNLYYRLSRRTVRHAKESDLDPDWVKRFYALAPTLNLDLEPTP